MNSVSDEIEDGKPKNATKTRRDFSVSYEINRVLRLRRASRPMLLSIWFEKSTNKFETGPRQAM